MILDDDWMETVFQIAKRCRNLQSKLPENCEISLRIDFTGYVYLHYDEFEEDPKELFGYAITGCTHCSASIKYPEEWNRLVEQLEELEAKYA